MGEKISLAVPSVDYASEEKQVERPSHLTKAHWDEWVIGSKISTELTALNVESLTGVSGYEYLLYASNIPRRNDGRLTDHWLKKYRHLEHGGWWCGTVLDPLWGCFKSNHPRRNQDHQKLIKYEHPPRVSTGVFALKVTVSVWQHIASHYNVAMPKGLERAEGREQRAEGEIREECQRTGRETGENGLSHPPLHPTPCLPASFGQEQAEFSTTSSLLPSASCLLPSCANADELYHLFWEWVINHPEIPIVITEGVKKAACLLTASYVALALPGIFNGYRQPSSEMGQPTLNASLIPHLAPFTTKGRTFYFAFDSDQKPTTVANVRTAISQTGWLLGQQGCQVRVIEWSPELGKGVDDLIVSHGIEAFDAAYKAAKPLAVWKANQLSFLTYEPTVRVNRRYLHNIPLPTDAKVIGLKAPKGTGKTELISEWAAEATSKGQWVLIITHRIQLGEALCQRFGIPYVTELKDSETGAIFGYGLCVDSLHPGSQARFQAPNWSDGVVILDESEQVLWHMLNSSTCHRDRVPILKSFKTLIQNVLTSDGRVILSDADLSDVSIDYIKQLSGGCLTPFIIQNDWKPSGWKVSQYSGRSPTSLIASLLAHIQEGGKPMVCVSGQKRKSKWSTTTLERFLQDRFPDKRILRIDSESVSDPNHPAYCCISKLNQILLEYDLVIASPSIETGVSIDITGHFTSVWGISHGLTPVTSFLQTLSRVRADVPRHIWVARRGLGEIGNGSSSIKNLLSSQHKLTKANIGLLQMAGYDALDAMSDYQFQQESLLTWAKMATRINATMPGYGVAVVEALKAEGHTVVAVSEDQDVLLTHEVILEGISQTRDLNYAAIQEAISQAASIDEKQYELLKDKRAKTQCERLSERKHSLELRYGIDVSKELVAMDDEGLYPKLRLHYFLSLGREHLRDRDQRAAQAQVDTGDGDVWQPDFNASQMGLRVVAFDKLGITPLLSQPGLELRNSDVEVQAIAEKALSNPWQVKAILGLSVGKNEAPIRIVGRLLGLAGVRLEYVRREGSRGQRERVYRQVIPDDGRNDIFAVWLERDLARREGEVSVSRNLIDPIYTQAVDEGEKIPCPGI